MFLSRGAAEPLGVAEGAMIGTLPDWAAWVVRVGEELSRVRGEYRVWMAITAPTRLFLACLAAAGAVRGAIHAEHQDQAGHFASLAGLPPDTPITWVGTDGMLRSGYLLGTEVDHGVDCLVYRQRTYAGIGPTTKRLRTHCELIQPMDPGAEPFAGRRPLALCPAFARAVAGVPLEQLAGRSRLTSLLVGEATTLEIDLRASVFAAEDATGTHVGCLLDVVRARRFLHAGAHFRSDIIPSVSTDVPDDIDAAHVALTVFDGPQGFLRLRDAAPGNLLFVIDRWSPSSAEAVGEFLRERAVRSTEDVELEAGPPPAGIEAIAWAEVS